MSDNTQDEAVSDAAPKYRIPGDEQGSQKSKPLPFEEGKLYTYSEYLTWDDDRRWELIEGVPMELSGPTWKHQDIAGRLYRQLADYLDDKTCKVFIAPVDVRLNADTEDTTVVQPDVFIVCDHSKLDDGRSCKGPPDMTIEVLSPGSIQHDRLRKLHIYEKYGIREYWLIEPDSKSITVYTLNDGKYDMKPYPAAEKVKVGIFEDCIIDLTKIFNNS